MSDHIKLSPFHVRNDCMYHSRPVSACPYCEVCLACEADNARCADEPHDTPFDCPVCGTAATTTTTTEEQ